jgi:hypothetical protein
MSISKQRVRAIAIFVAFLVWYAIFEWRAVGYPSYDKGPCYSPNHAYYITRHRTLWESLGVKLESDTGMARLFDQSGKLLYEGETSIDGQSGPMWSGGSKDDPRDPPAVFFMGGDGSSWIFTLPDSPGNGNPNKNCYPSKVE